MRTILILTLIFLSASCTKNKKSFDLFEKDEKGYILKHGISQITEIEVGLDTSGNSLWKRTKIVKYYDKNGLLIKTISPGYAKRLWPIKEGGMTPAEMSYMLSMINTDIPDGNADTTVYSYDKNDNLVSIKNSLTTTLKYDDNNNLIEKCISSELKETNCQYFDYKYDSAGNIISKKDSIGPIGGINNLQTKKVLFKYDKEGRIISNGEYERKFNNKGQLIEVKKLHEPDLGSIFQFSYDKKGKKVSEISTRLLSSSRNNKKFYKININRKYFYYDKDGLLIQEKILDNKNKLISLINYEYSF